MKNKPHSITDKMKDKMVELYEKGKSTVEIGRIIGCSNETVRYHLVKKGVKIRKSGDGVALRRKLKKPQCIEMDTYFKIPLTHGEFALVDKDDFEELNKHNWTLSNERRRKYAMRKAKEGEPGFVNGSKTRGIRMHQVILDVPEGMEIDHINGNGIDNRKSNLRIVTTRQNQQNRHIKYTSKYPGVYKDKRGKWNASIKINGKQTFLGRYDKEEDAYNAYKKACESIGEKVLPETMGHHRGEMGGIMKTFKRENYFIATSGDLIDMVTDYLESESERLSYPHFSDDDYYKGMVEAYKTILKMINDECP